MLKKIKNRINFNKLVKNSDNKKYIIIASLVIGSIIILLLFFLLRNTSLISGVDSSVKKEFNDWVLIEEDNYKYTVSAAIDKSLDKVNWKYDKNVDLITISGVDKSTNDKIVMTFTSLNGVTFNSMTRNDIKLTYSDWFSYLISYK